MTKTPQQIRNEVEKGNWFIQKTEKNWEILIALTFCFLLGLVTGIMFMFNGGFSLIK